MLKALIVTVAYNPPTSLLDNLQVDYYPHMVVDNSEQETIWLKNYCAEHNHVYQWLGDNLGIAKALNVGAEYAIEHGFDYIVTMDQDSRLNVFMLVSVTHFIIDFSNNELVALFSPFHSLDGIKSNSSCVMVNEIVMTSGNFVNLSIWKKLNGYNELLFIDMVDGDFCSRAIINGYQTILIPWITLEHTLGIYHSRMVFFGVVLDTYCHNKIRKFYQARNTLYCFSIYKKYKNTQFNNIYEFHLGMFKEFIVKMPLKILCLEEHKISKLIYFFKGVFSFLLNKFICRM